MKLLLAAFVVLLYIVSIGCARESERAPVLQARLGLPNLAAKLKSDAPLTVAYIGGSITEPPQGWTSFVTGWLQHQTTGKVTAVNAAIGASGSNYAVCRLQEAVLQHKPDLLLVEFAVNDNVASDEVIRRSMEGLVRQVWRKLPWCDIAFVYTPCDSYLPALEKGELVRTMKVQENVAAHYGIPSINLGLAIADLIKQGKFVWNKHTDGFAHPTPEGHKIYGDLVNSELARLLFGKPAPHALGVPLDTQNYENATLISACSLLASGDWKALDRPPVPNYHFSTMLVSKSPGAVATLYFQGRAFGFYGLMLPDMGKLEVRLDEGDWEEVPVRYFDWMGKGSGLWFGPLCETTYGFHRAQFRVVGEPTTETQGTWVRLGYIGIY